MDDASDSVLRLLRCLQLQALMRTIWVHAVPILGGVMIIIAVWFLFLSKVRACCEYSETGSYGQNIAVELQDEYCCRVHSNHMHSRASLNHTSAVASLS